MYLYLLWCMFYTSVCVCVPILDVYRFLYHNRTGAIWLCTLPICHNFGGLPNLRSLSDRRNILYFLVWRDHMVKGQTLQPPTLTQMQVIAIQICLHNLQMYVPIALDMSKDSNYIYCLLYYHCSFKIPIRIDSISKKLTFLEKSIIILFFKL